MKKRQQILLNLCIIPILLYNYVVLVKISQKTDTIWINNLFWGRSVFFSKFICVCIEVVEGLGTL